MLDGLCACLRLREETWLRREDAQRLAVLGGPHSAAPAAPLPDAQELFRVFRDGWPPSSRSWRGRCGRQRSLRCAPRPSSPAHKSPTRSGRRPSARSPSRTAPAHVSRDHLLRAAVPLYLGRVAAFAAEYAGRAAGEVEGRLAEL